jgi:hypothetical protein
MLFMLWPDIDLVYSESIVQLSSSFFKRWFHYSLSNLEIETAMSLFELELIFNRECQFTLLVLQNHRLLL